MRLEKRDTTFVISPDLRSKIVATIDIQALETLLQWLPANARDWYLKPFLLPIPDSAASVREDSDSNSVQARATIPDIEIVIRVSDPVIQNLLEDVWQPYWSTFSDEELRITDEPMPGLERAKRRRFG